MLHCILWSCARHYLTVYLKDSKMFLFVLTLWFNASLLLFACPSRGTAGFYFVQNRNMVAGHALEGFTYKDVTTADTMSCFHRCSSECRCISFNIHTTNNTLKCQLNEENRNTKPQALVASPEFNHYDLVIDYPSEGESSLSGDCWDYNSCCETNPCLNEGQCTPNCDEKGKRFICHCPHTFTGAVCQLRRPRNCAEVWDQGWRQSGRYVVLDHNENNLTMYCDFDSEPEFLWTLVESFSLENVGQFRYMPFFKTDYAAVNEVNPDWSEYKMLHAHAQHVRTASTHWRATCNYPAREIDYTDYLRTSFDAFNILMDPVTSTKCQTFEIINIRGISCLDCTAGVLYGGNHGYTFHIDSQKSRSVVGCQFDGSNGALSSEDNFGYYGVHNSAFSCTESTTSTTQIWFGKKK